jgi:FdhE protein
MAYRAARSPAEIDDAAAALKTLRPAYTQILDFYLRIFQLQEASKARTSIEPVRIPQELLQTKLAEKFPLISVSEFSVDPQACRELLQNLCALIKDSSSSLADDAGVMARMLSRGAVDSQALFGALLSGDDSIFHRVAAELHIDEKALATLVYTCTQPSLSLCAEQLAVHLPPADTWQKGYCPICGSSPGLSFFTDEGDRRLICSFCWWTWPIKRRICSHCHNTDDQTLQYFFSEQEEDWRVDLCDGCRRYIKTLDTRKVSRLVYFPLEQIASLHLDLKAREMGYESPGSPKFSVEN